MSNTQLSVSIVMPTLNSMRTLDACLKSIREQNYPQEKIEIIIIDGGSTDATKQTAEKYNCKFIEGGYKDNQEPRKGIGLLNASKDLVAYIDSDNILPDSEWMNQSVKPFLEISDLTGAETLRYGLMPGFAYFNRYCALIGANDPVALYLGKSEKLSWLYDNWQITPVKEKRSGYFIVEFNENNMLTLGGNGYFSWRELMLKSNCQPEQYFHIDVVMDLVKLGYTKFAMVENEIYHDTASSLKKLTSRRKTYFKTHNPMHGNRRYLLFNPTSKKDILKLGLFVLYSATFIQPLLFSLRGYLKKRDSAWFLHPIVCFAFMWAYSSATISLLSGRMKKK